VRRCDPNILLIVLAGATGARERARLLKHGAHDVVRKDDLARLGETIARRMASRARSGARPAADRDRPKEPADADRARSELLAVVVHELRTPLTAIKGSLALLHAEVTGRLPVKAAAMVALAHANAERLARLVNDILDNEKIGAGAMAFAIRPVALSPLLAQAADALESYLEQCRVTLALEVPADLGIVMADPDRLVQVLNNLISNAAKFSPEGEAITLTAEKAAGRVRIAVVDHGPGIAEEFRRTIFDRFTQANAADLRRLGSTGLGLNISRAIVERHGGRLDFDTRTGHGTSFYFDLPAVGGPLAGRTAAEARPRPRILVLDHDRNVRRRIKRLITELGYDVTTCASADTARKRIGTSRFAAITLDIALPRRGAIDIINELRRALPTQNLPIIAIAAEPRAGRSELFGRALDIVDWVDTPSSFDRLKCGAERVARDLDGRALRILHVANDRGQLSVVARTLKHLGTVERARTAHKAAGLLDDAHYDLVILDPALLSEGGGRLLLQRSRNGEGGPRLLFSPVRPVLEAHLAHMAQVLGAEQSSGPALLGQIHGLLSTPRAAPQTESNARQEA
jgi:signal transduction histidine kinase/DNA-binding response OmpR family regulator